MLVRIFTVVFYSLLGILILGFIFSNREIVGILIPFAGQITAPLYIALSLTFALGLLIGLSYAALLSLSAMRRDRRNRRALTALEKEVASREVVTKP